MHRRPPRPRRSGPRGAALVPLLAALLLAACGRAPDPDPGPDPGALVVASFAAETAEGPAPLSTRLAWTLDGLTDGAEASCEITVGDEEPMRIHPCPASGSAPYLFEGSPEPVRVALIATAEGLEPASAETFVRAVPGDAPTISELSASSARIAPGGSSVLSWSVSGPGPIALALDSGEGLEPLPAGATRATVRPEASTTFTLVASNPWGRTEREIVVQVGDALAIASFRASDATLAPGEAASLSWSVVGGEAPIELTLEGGPEPRDVAGLERALVAPSATTDYALVARDASGAEVRRELRVLVGRAPSVEDFTVSDDAIPVGGSVDVAWRVAGDGDVRVELAPVAGVVARQGTLRLAPTSGLLLELTAVSPFGRAEATLAVAVGDLPSIRSFRASSRATVPGRPVDLTWSATGPGTIAFELVEEGADPRPVGPSGATVAPDASTTYVLRATSEYGTSEASLTVTVGDAPALPSFEASPAAIAPGGSTVLRWEATGGDAPGAELRLALSGPGFGPVDVTGLSSYEVTVAERSDFVLSATSAYGSASRTATVAVGRLETSNAIAGASGDRLGSAVALSGDRLAAGAPRTRNADGVMVGAVRLFAAAGDGWSEESVLYGSAEGGDFGLVLALDGDRLVIGVPRDDAEGDDAGAALIYERGAEGWALAARLIAPSPSPYDLFGWSVAAADDRVFVGAPKSTAGGSTNRGLVHVFERVDGTWTATASLTSSDPRSEDHFGSALAAEGGRLVVGAPEEWYTRATGTGRAFVFERADDGAWNPTATLEPSLGGGGARFGWALALSGGRVAIGAPRSDAFGDEAGAVHVFSGAGATWVEEAVLEAEAPAAGAAFGASVALDGDVLVAGEAAGDDAERDAGGARLFLAGPDGWTAGPSLYASGAGMGDRAGEAIAADAGRVALGAPRADPRGTDSGAVRVFDATP